ncbi:MAG: efflux RND transporter periplasmic adaptor subunit [Bacteroidota bacterium]
MSFSKISLGILVLLALGTVYYFMNPATTEEVGAVVKTDVRKGPFVINVTATGELKAKRSEKIRGPQGMRTAGIWQTTISDMVAEGTVVKQGDYVASLDKTELTDKLREAQTEIEKIQTQLDQAKIDTAIEMRGLRDELVNLKFARKEKLLQVEQSKYEAPSVIQQAQLDLERTDRDYSQLTTKYELSQERAEAKISEINTSLKQNQIKLDQLKDLSQSFQVMAPKDGMVIYARSWDGKIGPGSQVRAWDPVVAELPDLSDMVSKTYVNEVDISRVRKGQEVKLKVDAFPDNEYTGHVIKVANIGEQLRNYDSKVFEVTVQMHQVDSILRPAMTTSNEIVTDVYESVLSIPLEALFSDSVTYVYKEQEGSVVRQEVIAGASNDDEIIIAHGLEDKDEIYLSAPEGGKDLPFVPLDEKVKDDIRKQLEEDRKRREAQKAEMMKRVKDENIPDDNSGGGGFIIIN